MRNCFLNTHSPGFHLGLPWPPRTLVALAHSHWLWFCFHSLSPQWKCSVPRPWNSSLLGRVCAFHVFSGQCHLQQLRPARLNRELFPGTVGSREALKLCVCVCVLFFLLKLEEKTVYKHILIQVWIKSLNSRTWGCRCWLLSQTRQEVGGFSRKARLFLLQATEECASEKKNEKGNKGRRKLSLAISHRTQKWSWGASETNHGGGFNQRHNLERGTCFPHCDSREEAWEKSHSSLLKKRVKTRGQDAVWTTTLQYRLLRCSVDCHVTAWLPCCSMIARLHLGCPLVLRTFILQSLLRSPILNSSDAVLWLLLPKSRGLQGPITEPSSLFCSRFKNNWRS